MEANDTALREFGAESFIFSRKSRNKTKFVVEIVFVTLERERQRHNASLTSIWLVKMEAFLWDLGKKKTNW